MNMHRGESFFLATLVVALLAFAGCNGSSTSGMSGAGGAGTFNLAIADTPVDSATSVTVTFTSVEVAPRGVEEDGGGDQGGGGEDQGDSMMGGGMTSAPGAATGSMPTQGDDDGHGGNMGGTGVTPAPGASTVAPPGGDNDVDDDNSGSQGSTVPSCSKCISFTFPAPVTVDLMQQQGGSSASLLSGVKLPAGNYDWIRLMVDQSKSSITLTDGSVHPLIIPSDAESGLKLVHGFTVGAGGMVDFTVDFDLRRSVILANGQYILKPVLRIVNNLDVGQIGGTVANTVTFGSVAISDPTCGPAAYVYAGSGVTPTPISVTSASPAIATEMVKLDNDTGNYGYRVPFLAPGSYTVTVACGALDTPTTAGSVVFLATKNATVTSDNTTQVNFP